MKASQLIKGLLSTLSALLICAASANTVFAHDVYVRDHRWHPAPPVHQVVRSYNYVYYPFQQVYYGPAQRNWYWANGGAWQSGNRLPYGVNVDMRIGGVPIVLSSPRPYVEHVYVEQNYGRPWRDRHSWHREWREERHERHHGHHWR
ncbi:MAG: hypothetical protein HYR68_00950 [Burkholderiales bacterium]|nr:hypothetical protein [Burkholderiales bacterium]MBI3727023.1 hypothetical protein [Burkholderiales bacterium]